MNDPNLREPEPLQFSPEHSSQPWQTQPWQPWTLIVPALLLLPMVSLAFAWQISPSSDADLRRPIYRYPRAEETPESQPEPTPAPQPAPTEQAPPSVTKAPDASNALPQITYFLPDENGQLERKTFSTIGGQRSDFASLGKAALNALFPDAPAYFPPGSQTKDLTLEESATPLALVSLNENFWQAEFWAGETHADIAMQAIAHTLEALYRAQGRSQTLQIQLLREGQPMEILGQFDVSEPFVAEPDAVAKENASSSAPVDVH